MFRVWRMMKLTLPRKLQNWCKTYPDALAALLCAILTLLGWLALSSGWLGGGIWMLLAAYIIGGYEPTREGVTTLSEERELDVDLLMIVAALGAAILGFWQQDYYLLVDGAVLILIFASSGALETIALHRTERNIRSLMQLTPDTARVVQQGREQIQATEELQIGDRILVKPGELFPTDGIIHEGCSTINQAPITGESFPVEKGTGDEVFAGTINGQGALTVELHKPPESSLIQRVIRLVEQAQTNQPPSQQFLEQFERGYAKIVVLMGLGLATIPPLWLGWDWETTIYRALIFLVVASPCALMAAIMPTLLSGIAKGARQGILFKDGAQLESMGDISAIAFDKTGTLTLGQLNVSTIIPAAGYSKTEVLQVAASLEDYSEHPLAQAILQTAQAENISLLPATGVQAKVGQGITGYLQEQQVTLGNRKHLDKSWGEQPRTLIASQDSPQHNSGGGSVITPLKRDSSLSTQSQHLETQGQTVIWVARKQQILGLIAVSDQIRPQAAPLLATLKQMGIKTTVMLTGDNAATAQTVAQTVGVDVVYSDLLPEDKVQVVQQLQQKYSTVAMVGDGINDAPALAQANLGITMGGAGSDMALETADIVLMANRLEKLPQAIRIGQKSKRIIRQNITLALASVVLLIIANFFGELTLPAGVLGHEGSTLLVTLNGLRLLR
ncbi:heavy metal translocating P-type ATPase [Spirulina sp. CS-785/01]|uniref:heavy metal translocating P-type ATPase n=1 Tax=Spirulina sp. CS-785/01 TaxID=3021716 RepID=UPI00232BFA54|nr:heavy metal translocating P-type ATPase [Spirulina sp. CS-785/01]MDB9314738.1 heavy metal translocating P-type ATPase [Spirulina sp. CS-785/01]